MDRPILPLSLEEGLARYKASKVRPEGFNLFCLMSNWHNERYLHSSFIGMMLSMKREFLVLFLEKLMKELMTQIKEIMGLRNKDLTV